MDIKARLANYASQIKAKIEEANKLAEDENFSPDAMKALTEGIETLKERIESLKALDPAGALWLPGAIGDPNADVSEAAREKSDAATAMKSARSHRSNFQGETREARALKAYRFAQWFRGEVVGNRAAKAWCEERGIKAQSSQDFDAGGAWIPEEFVPDLIVLRERYGKFRQYANVVPMTSDTRVQPRLASDVTTYYVDEGDDITDSQIGTDNVRLNARKLAALIYLPNEINSDSAVSMGNAIMDSIARGFARAEDKAGFIGDGSSTYGGQVGVTQKLKALSSTIADISGLQVATGNTFAEFVLADFNRTVGLLPEYADDDMAAWFCHRSFFYGEMQRLALAAGGTTATEIVDGKRRPIFLGYPVVFVQDMPKTDANSQVAALLGRLDMAAMLGDREGIALEMDTSFKFGSDQITVRGKERFHASVHDVGNATSTAADKQAGPIVGLISAAS